MDKLSTVFEISPTFMQPQATIKPAAADVPTLTRSNYKDSPGTAPIQHFSGHFPDRVQPLDILLKPQATSNILGHRRLLSQGLLTLNLAPPLPDPCLSGTRLQAH